MEAGYDHDLSVIQVTHDSVRINLFNTSFGIGVVSQNSDLRTSIAASLHTQILERHREKTDGDLFACGGDHIEFARIRVLLNFFGQGNQAIGFSAHRRDDNYNLMAGILPLRDTSSDIFDALNGTD